MVSHFRSGTDTLAHLKDAFQAAFKTKDSTKWSKERALCKLEQQPSQTVLQYITSVRSAAQGLDLTDDQTIRLIIGGLHPNIRTYVLQQNPTTMAELLATASTAGCTIPAIKTDMPNTLGIDTLLEEIRSLRHASVIPQCNKQQTPRSPPAPRQVRFKEIFTSPPDATFRQPRLPRQVFRSKSPSANPPVFHPHPHYVPQRAAYQLPPSLMTGPQQQPITPSKCQGCGKSGNTRATCRARNLVCHFCQKVGHIQSVCRQRDISV